jgi:DNA primase
LVKAAAAEVRPEQLQHPGVRRLIEALYAMLDEGEPPDIEGLRYRIDSGPLIAYAFRARDIGLTVTDRSAWLERLLLEFQKRRAGARKQELHNQLHAAGDDATALELLRQLQSHGEP